MQGVFAPLSIGLPRRIPASEAPFFLDALLLLGVGGSEQDVSSALSALSALEG